MAEHYGDIVSDLSVFHRVDDPDAMPIARYLGFAHRLAAYGGVMTRLLSETVAQPQGSTSGAATVDVGGQAVPLLGADPTPEQIAAAQQAAFAQRHGVDPGAVQHVSPDRIVAELMG